MTSFSVSGNPNMPLTWTAWHWRRRHYDRPTS